MQHVIHVKSQFSDKSPTIQKIQHLSILFFQLARLPEKPLAERLINSSYQRGRNWTNYVKRHDLCISSDNFPSLERKKKERFTERRIGNKKGRRTDSRHERIPVHVGGKLIRYPWHRQYNQRIYPVWKTSSVQRAYLCATAKGLTRCPRPSRTRL